MPTLVIVSLVDTEEQQSFLPDGFILKPADEKEEHGGGTLTTLPLAPLT